MTSKLLLGAMALLSIDGVLELAFITSMVRWLHVRAGKDFLVNDPNGTQFPLHGKPANFLLNQGHASNGAGGTAFIVIGFGGFLALWLRHRQMKRDGDIHGFVRFFYNAWLTMTFLSAIYSLACFVYVMVETYSHNDQTINISVASKLNNHPYPNYVAYPLLEWTPQNWFAAVLQLPLASSNDRSNIRDHLTIMHGWEWNLIPMTILGFVVMTLAFMDRMSHQQRENRERGAQRLSRNKQVAPLSP